MDRNGLYSNTLTQPSPIKYSSNYAQNPPHNGTSVEDSHSSSDPEQTTSNMPTVKTFKTYKSSPSKTYQKSYGLQSSYAPAHLKSFISNSFSSDEEKEDKDTGATSFFSGNKLESWHSPNYHQDDIKTEPDDTFPTFKSKRKRSYSSSSSESNISKKTFSYCPQPAVRKGPITGTFSRTSLSRAVYKPRFPSDDSVKSSDSNKPSDSFPSISKASSDTDLNSNQCKSEPQSPQSRSGSPSPDSSPFPPASPPRPKSPVAQRCRVERSAAQKAHQLIREIAPPVRSRHDSNLAYQEEDFTDDATLPKYVLDTSLTKTLPPLLQQGYKLYSNIRNDRTIHQQLSPFMYPVDSAFEDTKDYYKKIDKPMCLQKVEEKMANLDYFSTPEIIADLRLIFENCYKFNGAEVWISKFASKVEMSLEQRITTLPYSMREKCSLQETSPHLTLYRDVCGRRTRTPRIFTGSTKTPIMLAMEELQLYKEREIREIQTQVSKRKEDKLQETTILLSSLVANNPDFQRICSSHQFISSCVMICVCQEAFDIGFTVLDLELGMLYPQYSDYLSDLFLNLACSKKAVRELRRDSIGGKVSYEAWNAALLHGKLTQFYLRLKMCGRDRTETQLGIHPLMFDVFGDWDCGKSPVKDKMFHELSLTQRLAILYTLCHHKLDAQPSLINSFLEYESDSLRRHVLGSDVLDNVYFYFPLWPEEVRVYVELPGNEQEVKCVCRSVDDIQRVIDQLTDTGTLTSLIDGTKTSKRKRSELSKLIRELMTLHNAQLQHQPHHLLVESTVYKRLAACILEKDGQLEPAKCPPTPPPAREYIEITDSTTENEEEEEEEEDDDEKNNIPHSNTDDQAVSNPEGDQMGSNDETEHTCV